MIDDRSGGSGQSDCFRLSIIKSRPISNNRENYTISMENTFLFIIQQSLKILTSRGLAYQAVDAIARGLIATLFVQLSVLNMPMSRSANSNMLFRKLMIMNCAFLVLSCRENIKSKRTGKLKRFVRLSPF